MAPLAPDRAIAEPPALSVACCVGDRPCTRIQLAVCDDVDVLAVIESANLAALVPVGVLPVMDSVAIGFAVVSLAEVGVDAGVAPQPVAFHHGGRPLFRVPGAVGS